MLHYVDDDFDTNMLVPQHNKGEFIITPKGRGYCVTCDWGRDYKKDLKYGLMDMQEGNAAHFIETVLAHHGMRETTHGNYMLDTGSIIKQLCEMNMTLKQTVVSFAESNKQLAKDFKQAVIEDNMLKGRVKNFSILEEPNGARN